MAVADLSRNYAPRLLATALLGALLACGGCYNRQSLIEQARNNAIRTRVEEVNLGEYRIALPTADGGERVEILLRMVGTTLRNRQEALLEGIAEHRHVLRHNVVLAVRETTREELADPDLLSLRQRLLATTKAAIGSEHLENLVLADLRIVPM